MKELLFVYGTLRRGGGHDLEKMVGDARYRGSAVFQGEMALVDYFPGVRASDDPAATVFGEVYELAGDGKSLKQLDEFEDFRPEDSKAGVYLREKHGVRLDSGEICEVWIYIYNRPWEHFPKIESGDYVRFLKQSATGSME